MKNITRRNHDPQFKARVVKELLKEDQTIAQVCSEYKIHPSQASAWKHQALENITEGFKNPLKKNNKERELEDLTQQLYNQIGQLTVEVEWLKKKL